MARRSSLSNCDGRDHSRIVPVNGGEPQQLTRGSQTDGAPSWALDGQRIAYHADVGGVTQIFVISRSGGTPRQITEGATGSIRPVWSPDGKKIAFARFADNQWNIYTMNSDGSDVKRLTDTSYNVNPAWSPDAKQILFQSDREGGNQQVFVMSADGGTARRVTQLTGINQSPWWPLR
jgi:TolB protein